MFPIGRYSPQFTPPPPTASTQPSAVNPAADFARPHPPHPASFRLSGNASSESAERNQRLQSALYCGWYSLRRVEEHSDDHTNCYQADVSLSPGQSGTVMAIFEKDAQVHNLTTLRYMGSETDFDIETGEVLPEQASQTHPPHPGSFRLFGDDSSVSNESNQRLRSALQCGWYSLRQVEEHSDDHTNCYQADVSLSPGQSGTVMAIFEKDAQVHNLTTLRYMGSETDFDIETGEVLPGQASPSARPALGELTQLSPLRLFEELSTGSSPPTMNRSRSPIPGTLDGAAFQPTQLGGTQTQGTPLERQRSLKQLVRKTIAHAQETKRGKNSQAIMKKFERGIAAINAKPGKTPIDQQEAAAFYAKAAGSTRLPQELSTRSNATKAQRAKKMLGPDGTSTEYPGTLDGAAFQPTQLGGTQTQGIPLERKKSLEQLVQETILHAQHQKIGKTSRAIMEKFERGIAAVNAKPGKTPIDQQEAAAFYANASAGSTRLPQELSAKFTANKEKRAKKKLGPNATIADYERKGSARRAKETLGSNATGSDYERVSRANLAKKKLGPNATAAEYNRTGITVQAIRELGPTATVADLAKLQGEERVLAAQLGVPVKEVRRERRQAPASMEPSFSGPNQRQRTPGPEAAT